MEVFITRLGVRVSVVRGPPLKYGTFCSAVDFLTIHNNGQTDVLSDLAWETRAWVGADFYSIHRIPALTLVHKEDD